MCLADNWQSALIVIGRIVRLSRQPAFSWRCANSTSARVAPVQDAVRCPASRFRRPRLLDASHTWALRSASWTTWNEKEMWIRWRNKWLALLQRAIESDRRKRGSERAMASWNGKCNQSRQAKQTKDSVVLLESSLWSLGHRKGCSTPVTLPAQSVARSVSINYGSTSRLSFSSNWI